MPTSLGVWSLELFSSIFFLHILKQKKKKKKSSDFPVETFVGSRRLQSGRVKFSKVQGFDNF